MGPQGIQAMRLGSFSFQAIFVCSLLVPGLATAQFQAEIGKTEAEAYRELTSGAVWDGTVRLIELLRDAPGDDPALADAMVGPAQLLGFSVAFLMDWGDRRRLLGEVLDPKTYVTDKLLIAALKCGADLHQVETFGAIHDLQQIAEGDHEAAAATAMCALADSYYFRKFPHIQESTARVFLNYGNLELARALLRQEVRRAVRDSRSGDAPVEGTLFKNIIYAGGRADTIRAADPVLARVTDGMTSYRLADLDAAAVTQWADLIANDPDPRVRYTCLLLSASWEADEACKDGVAAARRTVAARAPNTPDVPLARVMLLEDARKRKDFAELEYWTDKVLAHGMLPATPERCLYENDVRAVRHAAETLTRYGRFAQAEHVQERLAVKYPDSALSRACEAYLDALRSNPVLAALRELDREARSLKARGKPEEAERVYLDVAETTAHPGLAAACRDRASGLIKPPEDAPREPSGPKVIIPPLFRPLSAQ